MGKMSSILDTLESCVQGDIREETYFLSSETWLSSPGGRGAAVKGKCIEREKQRTPSTEPWGVSLLGWKKDTGQREEEQWQMQVTGMALEISV